MTLNSVFITKGSDEENEIQHSLSRSASEQEFDKKLREERIKLKEQQPSNINLGSQSNNNLETTEVSCCVLCWEMFWGTNR